MIYLLSIESDGKTNYIYIKSIDCLFNQHKTWHYIDKRLCPIRSNHNNKQYYLKNTRTCYDLANGFKCHQASRKRDRWNELPTFQVPTRRSDARHCHATNSACVYFCASIRRKNRLWYSTVDNCIVDRTIELTNISDERMANMQNNAKAKHDRRSNEELHWCNMRTRSSVEIAVI